jgi:hypothetical protein
MITIDIYPCNEPGMKYLVRTNATLESEKWTVPFQYDELVSRLRDDYPGCQIINHNYELKR